MGLPTTTVRTARAPGLAGPAAVALATAVLGGCGGPAAGPVPRPTSATAAADVCRVPAGVTAAQVVVVTASGTRATVRGCSRTDQGYRQELGPYRGHVGRHGVAPPGAKREGDGRTPSGVFPLREGFGSEGDPGVAVEWDPVGEADVWVDDPGSRLYNTRQRKPASGRWSSAEDLLIPAYALAQVIGYNEERIPGRGSAIFLHVDTGRATAGCVSVGTRSMRALLRWQRPGAVIAIS